MVILNKLNKNTVKLLIFANHNAYRKKKYACPIQLA